MKITTYLERLPIGEVITNKRVLSVLKRRGLIYDYSQWGYLESRWIYRAPREEGFRSMAYLFPQGNANDPILDDVVTDEYYWDTNIGDNIEYKGFKFSTKYLDGCFNAYLIKTDGPTTCAVKKVERRMSLGIMGGGVL